MKKLLFALLAIAVSPPLFAQESGTITSTQCVAIDVKVDKSTVGIQVTGTWAGTLQPQVSIQGQAAANTQVVPSTSTTPQSTITGNGVFYANVGGGGIFQICGNTVSSGTANIFLNGSKGVNAGTLSFGGGSIAAGTAGQPAVYTSGTGIGAKPWPQGTDITVGAVCDGSTNDATVLQANMTAAAGGAAFVPSGKICGTGSVLTLPVNTDLWIGAGGSLKATAAIAAVVVTPSASITNNPQIYGGGTIDGNGLANIGIWVKDYTQLRIRDLKINAVLVDGIRLGETGQAFCSGATVSDVVLTQASVLASSIGIWEDNSGDSYVGPNNQIIFFETGILASGSQNIFVNNHVWSGTNQFEDRGNGNIWMGNYGDGGSVSFHLASTSSRTIISGGKVYNCGTCSDNTKIGVQIDQAAPLATITGVDFFGQTNSNRIATDIVSSNGFTNVTRSGNQTLNVVTVNSGPSLPTLTIPGAGALSAPSFSVTGAPITAGNGTTTVPLAYINSGAAPTTWSTSGTMFGINAPNSFTGLMFDVRLNGGATVYNITRFGDADGNGSVRAGTYQFHGTGHIIDSVTAPTITSGFGSSPSIVVSNGTASFTINVGTGGTANSGVLAMPAATTGWVIHCTDLNTHSNFPQQTASGTASVTIGGFNSAGTATAWGASDVLQCMARGN